MDKAVCDQLILQYTNKLFAFAAAKTSSLERAEELASRITLEVYASLLRQDEIRNVNAYIGRIARNVYARYTDENRIHRWTDLDGLEISSGEDFTESVIRDEMASRLRLEIAYLSEMRRKVLIQHYYQNKKLSDIAKMLSIPIGTVKWHLSGARDELKERLDTMHTIGNLGLCPIELTNLGHDGHPGSRGDTADFLARRLTQNIAYAAYHQALTVNEIADELGVSPLFVADEVAVLEEYGFMDKLPGGKYRTNIYISEMTKEWDAKLHDIFCRYAAILRRDWVPAVIETLKGFDPARLYIPDKDENLWLWSGITWALGSIRVTDSGKYSADSYAVSRKDGGRYIAWASVKTSFTPDYDASRYNACGNMTRGSDKYPIFSWQLNTVYDTREMGWRENLYTDYESLYEFYTGRIRKNEASIEKYQRLRNKGYLRADDTVNLIVVEHGGANRDGGLTSVLPAANPETDKIARDLAEEIYAVNSPHYPEHMRPLCRAYAESYNGNGIRMRVLEQLVQEGILQLPKPEQAAGLNTLLFADTLPR